MNTSIIQPKRRNDYDDNFKKGCDFEEYVISLFHKEKFKVDKWYKSQKRNDYDPYLNLCEPDLHMIFRGKKDHRFAVECKWRMEFKDGLLQWARENQIQNYQDFSFKNAIPVFVAIGVGGQPSQPKKLFVTPLQNIERFTEVHESQLIPFKRKPTRRFFLDTHQCLLF